MDWRDYIEQRPDVMLGKPVIKGTRITVELILEKLAAGATFQDLLDSYPELREEHIRAALHYAAGHGRGGDDGPGPACAAAIA